jgi:hypothetical protein
MRTPIDNGTINDLLILLNLKPLSDGYALKMLAYS